MEVASDWSSFCMTAMLLRFRELSVTFVPYRIMPILSLSFVMILVFMKLRAARSTESMLLVDSHSGVDYPLFGFCLNIDSWQSIRKITESLRSLNSSVSYCSAPPNINISPTSSVPSKSPPPAPIKSSKSM